MLIAIQGIGVLGGFGCGMADFKRALSGRKILPGKYLLNVEKRRIEVPAFLVDTSPIESFYKKRELRRIDHYSKMALLGARLALEDARISNPMPEIDRQKMGIIIATGYGAVRTSCDFLDSLIDDGDICASPLLFSNSVHNAAASHLSIFLKAAGPNLTVSQFEMSVSLAFLCARQWLEEKRVDSVLLGGVDIYSDLLGYCYYRFFSQGIKKRDLHLASVIKPFDFNRQSAVAGEGAVFFLLTRCKRDDPKYGFINYAQIGNSMIKNSGFSENALLIIGSDGHKECGRYYMQQISLHPRAAAYTSLYGSFPASHGFDIAVAALSLKERKIFILPECTKGINPAIKFGKDKDFGLSQIYCLKFGRAGEFGLVGIGRERDKTEFVNL